MAADPRLALPYVSHQCHAGLRRRSHPVSRKDSRALQFETTITSQSHVARRLTTFPQSPLPITCPRRRPRGATCVRTDGGAPTSRASQCARKEILLDG